jgi:hypothetical protein
LNSLNLYRAQVRLRGLAVEPTTTPLSWLGVFFSGDKKMPPAPLVSTEAIISHIEIHRHCREFHTRCLIVALDR